MAIGTEIDRLFVTIGADLTNLRNDLALAAKTIDQSVNGPLSQAALGLDDVFFRISSNIANSLTLAAETGKFSFKDMVNSILRDLQRLALNKFLFGPLNSFFNDILGGFSLSGSRAGGGPVLPGRAFMVGEHGPELFVPNSSGRIVPGNTSGAPTIINFNFPPGTDADSFRRSESQISALVSRVVSRGQRNL